MDYVRRRRLSVAVDALRNSKREILDIALDSGFESQEAFTRAFKAMFGVTPGVCRKDGARVLMLQAIPDITAEYIKHLYQGITMTPTIQTLPSRFVVGLERPFISVLSPQRNNHIVIPQLWQDFCGRMCEIKDAKGDANLGCVFCDDGETGMCRYLACSEVPSLADVPEGMTGYEILEGRYAVFVHKGVIGRIGETMNYIYGSWFPQSGQRYRNGPEIEIYGEKFDPESEQSEMEICIPIE